MTAPPAVIEVDALGLLCPLPLLRAEQALRRADGPTELLLWSDDAGILVDLPRWCEGRGLRLLELVEATHSSGRRGWRGRVKIGPEPSRVGAAECR